MFLFEEGRDELRSKGYDVHAVREDISTKEGVDRAFDGALAILGGDVDIVVNNAGIQRKEVCEGLESCNDDESRHCIPLLSAGRESDTC